MEQFLTGNFKIGQLFGFSYVCEETVTWDSGELFFSGGREKGDSLAMLKPPRLQKKAEFELQFPEDNLDVNFGEVGSSVSVDMDRRWQSGSRLDMDRPRPKELPFDIWRIIIDNVGHPCLQASCMLTINRLRAHLPYLDYVKYRPGCITSHYRNFIPLLQ